MRVALILPNRNNARWLAGCLRSVRDDPALTTIRIYDDASDDSSLEVIREEAGTKLRLEAGATPIGAAAARHRLIADTEEEFLFFLDGDDYLEPGTISRALDAALRDRLDLAVPPMVKVHNDGQGHTPFVPAPDTILAGSDAFAQTLGGWRIHAMGLLRRETYERAAGDFLSHGFSADELLTRHILLACSAIGPSKGRYFYRQIEKTRTTAQHLAAIRTDIELLAMALAVDADRHRDFIAADARRLARSLAAVRARRAPADEVARLASMLRSTGVHLPLPWRAALALLAGRGN